MALDPAARGALTIQGTSELRADCGVMVNSNNPTAIVANGGGCIYTNEIGVTGGTNMNGQAQCLYPKPTSDVPPAMDPMAWLAAPSLIGVTAVGVDTKITEGEATLNPGLYEGGIAISGGTVTFNPGTYILDSGFHASGNAILIGKGVTFYNTNTLGVGKWDDIDIAGTVKANLSAPDSGAYEGILFWNDAASPDRNPGSVIAGTSDSKYEGALYFPSTHVSYTGTSTAAWTMIIADTITISGNAFVSSEYDKTTILPPTRLATLVE